MSTLQLLSRATDNQTEITDFRNHCTLQTCDLTQSYFYYRPSLGANALFLALFSFSLLCFILQGGLSRRFIGFTIAMVSGCVLEVVGYVGRVQGWQNPFVQNPYLIQIVCLTIAPSFLAAGLYLTLSRIVTTFGPQNSRIAPLSYPRIFIPCDVFSLLLQAAGGGLASSASHQNKSPDVGDHILVAGVAFQVFTLGIFICLSLDFAIRTVSRMRRLGRQEALDPAHAKLRESWSFKGFLYALCFATICIFVRSVYRVVELGEGWTGALIRNENTFIGLESALVVVAVLSLNAFHPGYCFREGYAKKVPRDVKGSSWKRRGGRKARSADDVGRDGTFEKSVERRSSGDDGIGLDPKDKETTDVIASEG